MQVTFYPFTEGEDAPGDFFPAPVMRDGAFVVYGAGSRKGLPRGKYRIAVELLGKRGVDRWGGRFGPGNSPIIREVRGQELEIDLDAAD